MPFDTGHEEDVGKGQAGHRGGYPKGHGVGGFVDVYPVPALFDLQSSPTGTFWQPEYLAAVAIYFRKDFSALALFTFWAG